MAINRPPDQQTNRPPDHQTTRPTDQQTNRPTDHQTTRPTDHQTTRPPDHQTTRPTDHQTIRLPDYPTKLLTAAIAILLAALLVVPTAAQEPTGKPSPGNGSLLWAENCALCHGATGKGDGPTAAAMEFPPTDFTDSEAAKDREPAQMFIDIKEGRMEKLMPPWGQRLSDDQIWNVLYYARSLSLSSGDLSAGRDIYAANCAECHGEDGVSDEIDLSQPGLLVGKSDQTLFDDLRADQSTHAALSGLADEELWQSLAAVRSLSQDAPSFEGVLHGQVINASTDQPAANVDLLLYVLSQSGVMQTIPGISDEEGRFTFENLSTEHAIQYGLEGIYNNISYFSAEPIVFLPDTTAAEVTLNVYDTTEDPGAVSQSNMHRIIDLIPGLMHVVDVYVFSNSGSATYIGQAGADGQPVTVKIALPKEASNVNYQSQTLRMVEDGIYVDSEAITPGEGSYELVVTYEIPLDGKTLTLETPHFYDIKTINILATDRGEVIKSEQLSAKEPTTIQGDTFLMLTGSDLKAAQPLVMEFSNLNKIEMPAPPDDSPHGTKSFSPTSINARNVPEGPDQNILMWGILGLGVLATIFAVVYVSRQQPSETAASQAVLEQEQNRLLARLSELEALYQAGEIDDQTYQRLKHKNRTLLKQILVQLEQ